MKIINNGKVGQTYNIGSGIKLSNIDLVKKIIELFSKNNKFFNYLNLIEFVKDRPGHDFRYALNSNKLKKIGWKSRNTLNNSLIKTIKFYEKQISN